MMNRIDRAAIAEKMKAERLARGKSITEVAAETGIGRTALSNYELGIRIPRDEAKLILARYYQKTVEELFFSA